MLRKILLLSAFTIALSAAAAAQAAHTPDKGSAERKAILNALRIPVEKDLKQKVVFVANDFKVAGNWAFIGGEPQSADGGEPNYRGTRYQEAKDEGIFDNNFFALLRKVSGKWRVVTYAIGCTDVCYLDWPRKHKAPKSVFPYTE